jgi:hypothetical protein
MGSTLGSNAKIRCHAYEQGWATLATETQEVEAMRETNAVYNNSHLGKSLLDCGVIKPEPANHPRSA